jgi:hypothetical protein
LVAGVALLVALAGLLWLTEQSADLSPIHLALPLALALLTLWHSAPRLADLAGALLLLTGAGMVITVLMRQPMGVGVPFVTLTALLWYRDVARGIGRWHAIPHLIHPERMVRTHLLALVTVTAITLPLWLFATGARLNLTIWPVLGLALVFLYTLLQAVRFLARSAPPP